MEPLKHERGVAAKRLPKPSDNHQRKCGSWKYGPVMLYLMMQQQCGAGRDGACASCVGLDVAPCSERMLWKMPEGYGVIPEIFNNVHRLFNRVPLENHSDADYVRHNLLIADAFYVNHLRHSTTGDGGISYVFPVLRCHNRRSKKLFLSRKFDAARVDEIIDRLAGRCLSSGNHSDIQVT